MPLHTTSCAACCVGVTLNVPMPLPMDAVPSMRAPVLASTVDTRTSTRLPVLGMPSCGTYARSVSPACTRGKYAPSTPTTCIGSCAGAPVNVKNTLSPSTGATGGEGAGWGTLCATSACACWCCGGAPQPTGCGVCCGTVRGMRWGAGAPPSEPAPRFEDATGACAGTEADPLAVRRPGRRVTTEFRTLAEVCMAASTRAGEVPWRVVRPQACSGGVAEEAFVVQVVLNPSRGAARELVLLHAVNIQVSATRDTCKPG